MIRSAVVDNKIVTAGSDDQIAIDIEVGNDQSAFLGSRNITAVQFESASECRPIAIKGGVNTEMLCKESAVIIVGGNAIGDIFGVDIVAVTVCQTIHARILTRSRFYKGIILDGTLTILRILVVLVVVAVVFVGVLRGNNGNGNAVQSFSLIFIAGVFVHMSGDANGGDIVLLFEVAAADNAFAQNIFKDCIIVDGVIGYMRTELDRIQQLEIAAAAVYSDLILERRFPSLRTRTG